MHKIISILSILQVLYLTSRVESLHGQNMKKVRNDYLPFVASLKELSGVDAFCTGVLITKSHVITTASCLEGEIPAKTIAAFQIDGPNEAIATEVIYPIKSWQPYYHWAVGRGLHLNEPDTDGIAVIRLKEKVFHTNPARLSKFTKQNVIGNKAIITGWTNGVSHDGLQMSIVQFLNDEDCNFQISKITKSTLIFGTRLICSSSKTLALLEDGDAGAPIVDLEKRIIGLAFGRVPDPTRVSNISLDTLEQHQVNVHFSIDYYREFIVDITGYH